jgi:diaminohydroxyphosphoribosylaminopyrimidine deaminase/5-amino-6-(5-phosphoribosylamino)uracil reductase
MVGAVIVKQGRVLGQGWHRQAGQPHAEIEALRDAQQRGLRCDGATLYVTLEPCSTHGRTPPCTEAILRARFKRVVVAAQDPNPKHAGRGLRLLRRAGVRVELGLLAAEASRLNEAFEHWITKRLPFVVVKAAMTLDGKIATAAGESKWITGPAARRRAMHERRGADAILIGVNTVLTDDPALTVRPSPRQARLRRIILDAQARIPLTAQVVRDQWAPALTTIVVAKSAPSQRVHALAARVKVWKAPARNGRIELKWLLRKLGDAEVTRLLVEGGGEVNASFLLSRLAKRILFFYAPKILGGNSAVKAVGGQGFVRLKDCLRLQGVEWQLLGPDLMLDARVA